MTLTEAKNLTLELMEEHGVIQDGWVFQWSNGKRQLGCAVVIKTKDRRTGKVTEQKRIRISRHLVELNDDDEIRDTILHEIAHAIAGLKNGHNHVWRAVCRRIGAKPKRLAGEEVRVVEPPYMLICKCCQKTLGKRHRRMTRKQLASRYCGHCGRASKGKLEFQPNSEI